MILAKYVPAPTFKVEVLLVRSVPVPFQEASTWFAEVAEKLSDVSWVGQSRFESVTFTVPAVGTVKESSVDSEPDTSVVCARRMLSAQALGATAKPVSTSGATRPHCGDFLFIVIVNLVM